MVSAFNCITTSHCAGCKPLWGNSPSITDTLSSTQMSVFFTQGLPKFERRLRLRQPDDALCNIAAPAQANKHAGCERELIV